MSKTKSAVGAVCVLSPFAVLLCALWWKVESVKEAVGKTHLASSAAREVLAPLGNLTLWATLLFAGAAAIALGLILLSGNANAKPLKTMSLALSKSDISEDLPSTGGNDDIFHFYNSFIRKVREILSHTRRLGLEVAIGSTEVAGSVKDLRAKSKKHGELSNQIFFASTDMKNKIVDISRHTHSLQESTTVNLATAKVSLDELRKATAAVDRTGKNVAQFSQTMERLNTTSLQIKEMVDLIDEVSGQVHHLALKAEIEATRAGDKGKGFTLIAEEMKQTADRASGASRSEVLVGLNGMVREVNSVGGGIHQDIKQVNQTIGNTVRHFDQLVRVFEDNKEQLSGIVMAVEEVSSKNTLIHGQVSDIRELSQQVEVILGDSAQSAGSMNRKTEALLEAVSHFKIGNDALEEKITAVTACRDHVQKKIEEMAAQGVDVFDRNYRLVPNSKPQKYRTAYDSHFDKELQSVFDQAIAEMDGVYCVAADVNGYVATHHSKVSKPMTGKFEVDLLYSRDRRIYYSNDTETRRVKNTNRFLLQTYMRDTGEILNDLSMPIYVNGKHWGAIVSGFQPAKIAKLSKRAGRHEYLGFDENERPSATETPARTKTAANLSGARTPLKTPRATPATSRA